MGGLVLAPASIWLALAPTAADTDDDHDHDHDHDDDDDDDDEVDRAQYKITSNTIDIKV